VLTRLSVSIEVQDFALITYRVPADRVRVHLPAIYALQTHDVAGAEHCFITTTCFRNGNFRPTATNYPRHTFFESTYRTYVDYRGLHGVYFLGRYLETWPSFAVQRPVARHSYRADFDVSIDRDEGGYHSYRCRASSSAGDTEFSIVATGRPEPKIPWTTGEEHAQFLTFRPIGCFTSSIGTQMRGRVDHARLDPWGGRLTAPPRLDFWERHDILSAAEAAEPYSVLVSEGTRFFLYPPVPVRGTRTASDVSNDASAPDRT
jgi:uncharacterized protein YqjF (DUF2071 family)